MKTTTDAQKLHDLTKAALQGLCANPEIVKNKYNAIDIAELATRIAIATLELATCKP